MAAASLATTYSSSPHADDQRRALARRHERVGLVGARDGDAVRAVDLVQRRLNGPLEQRLLRLPVRRGPLGLELVVQVPDQHRQHLGVGLAVELVPLACQKLLQRGVVLDNAVVDERDAARVVQVRVGVLLRRRAVGGPARVRDAHARVRQRAAVALVAVDLVLEHADAPHRAANVQLAIRLDHGHAGRVVAAVLEALEPLDEHGLGDLAADVGDDSTHKRCDPSGRSLGQGRARERGVPCPVHRPTAGGTAPPRPPRPWRPCYRTLPPTAPPSPYRLSVALPLVRRPTACPSPYRLSVALPCGR